MKKCPFCAEEIQDEAIKCKHCQEMLVKRAGVPSSGEEKLPWYFSAGNLVVAALFVGPLMLPLVWFHPKMSRNKKIVITAIIVGISWVLGVMLGNALKSISHYFEMINDPNKMFGG